MFDSPTGFGFGPFPDVSDGSCSADIPTRQWGTRTKPPNYRILIFAGTYVNHQLLAEVSWARYYHAQLAIASLGETPQRQLKTIEENRKLSYSNIYAKLTYSSIRTDRAMAVASANENPQPQPAANASCVAGILLIMHH